MSTTRESAEVREAVLSWKRRQNQRYKILKFLVKNGNQWVTSGIVGASLYEIKDPGVVLYDMALRNPDNTPRGQRYYDRMRVYPLGSSAIPILEYDGINSYRIRSQLYPIVQESI